MAGRSFVANISTSVCGSPAALLTFIFEDFGGKKGQQGRSFEGFCMTFRSSIDNPVNSAEIIRPAFSSSFSSRQFPTWSSFEIIVLILPNGI